MIGTSFSATLARRPRPPKKTSPEMTAVMTPVTASGAPKAVFMACEIEFDCTALPMQPSAMMMAIEKKTARGLNFLPSPCVM